MLEVCREKKKKQCKSLLNSYNKKKTVKVYFLLVMQNLCINRSRMSNVHLKILQKCLRILNYFTLHCTNCTCIYKLAYVFILYGL